MPIDRQTEGTLTMRTSGRGTDTAVAKWVVGSEKLTIHQGDSRVELSHEQFAELMRASQELYEDIKPQVKEKARG